MKIANICIWSPPYTNDKRTGGLLVAMDCLAYDLRAEGQEVGKFYFSNKKRGERHIFDDYELLNDDNVGRLNDYDVVIFSNAGSFFDRKDGADLWRPHLKSLKRPFFYQIHHESEGKVLIYREEFSKHKYCRGVLPICTGMAEYADSDFSLPHLIFPAFPVGKHMRIKQTVKKRNQIITLCRMTSSKRIKELVEISPRLLQAGFKTIIYGAESSYFYVKALMDLELKTWVFKGTFDTDDLPDILGPARYLWNTTCFVHKPWAPRIEISTIEAAYANVAPIVHIDHTADWVTDKMAIRIDPLALSINFPRLLKARAEQSELMAKRFVRELEKQHGDKTQELIQFIQACGG